MNTLNVQRQAIIFLYLCINCWSKVVSTCCISTNCVICTSNLYFHWSELIHQSGSCRHTSQYLFFKSKCDYRLMGWYTGMGGILNRVWLSYYLKYNSILGLFKHNVSETCLPVRFIDLFEHRIWIYLVILQPLI